MLTKRRIEAILVFASILCAPSLVPFAQAATATVDAGIRHQVIRGFGGATAFRPTTPLAADDLDKLFGNGPGQIGFTLLRIRLASDDAWRALELANAKGAEARGARVIATPWSPPPAMKTNNNLVGGSLIHADYGAYAQYLNNFALYMARNGAPLYAISVQNEPDITVTYESCDWTADQMLDFCKNDAGAITATRLIAPESYHFDHSLSDPILNEPTATANVDIIGGHIYGGGLEDYPLARSKGKEVWMTEHLDLNTDWASDLATGKEIHDCLAVANFSAYLWWYVKRYYGPLGEDGVVTKRGYVMSQFAKFIRPGYVRVDATANPESDVYVSAYTGAKLVIVAINQGTSPVDQTFAVKDTTADSVTPWMTSSDANMKQESSIDFSNGSFTATLPAQSITTFVGNIPVPAPAITIQPQSHSVATGSTVVLDVSATGQYISYQWDHDGIPIPGASGRYLTINNAQASDAGQYTATVSNSGGSSTSSAANLTVVITSNPGRLINLSARSPAQTGDKVQIGGFVISGSGPKEVLLRAAGPTLTSAFGLSGTLPDPTIELYKQSTGQVIASNDNWDAGLDAVFKAVGAFNWTPGSNDAAISAALDPGAYTAVVKGADGSTGIDLVEIYDAATGNHDSRLVNLSARSLVDTGDGVQIAGFVIGGDTARTVVIRAAGPALNRTFGIDNALADPVIELHNQKTGAVIDSNDDWDASLAPQFAAVGALPWEVDSKDAALATTLDPGAYTVVVKGKNDTTGIALVEVYEEL